MEPSFPESDEGSIGQNIGFFDIGISGLVLSNGPLAGNKFVWISPERHRIVGRVLAAARRQRGLTQVEMAQRLGKPQSFVSAYEQGQRRVDILELIKIARTMDASARDLFHDIESAF